MLNVSIFFQGCRSLVTFEMIQTLTKMKYLSSLIVILLLSFNSTAQDTTKLKSTEPIVELAEVEPQYPGGEEAMIKFIQNNVVYPELSKELGEQGTVYVQFIVNRDGSISGVMVIRGVSDLLDAEAMRVIKLMPNWIPGMQKGKTVRVRYTIPINFQIDYGKKEKKKRK